MRIGAVRSCTSVRGPVVLSVLLHDFLMFGLFLLPLLRCQHTQHVAAHLDGGHAESNLQIFTLLQLCFNRSQVGRFVIGEGFQLPFSDLDLGLRLDTGLIQAQLEVF